MIIIHKGDKDYADNFINKYKKKIEGQCSSLGNHTIVVYDGVCFPEPTLVDNDSPMQCYHKQYIQSLNKKYPYQPDKLQEECTIIYNSPLCSEYTEEELYSLFVHEIGHLDYIEKGNQTENEEFYADDCAVALGLKDELKSALNKMKQKTNIAKIQDRIDRIK